MKKSQEPEQHASSSLRQLLFHLVTTPVAVSTRPDFRNSFGLTTVEGRQRNEIGVFKGLSLNRCTVSNNALFSSS